MGLLLLRQIFSRTFWPCRPAVAGDCDCCGLGAPAETVESAVPGRGFPVEDALVEVTDVVNHGKVGGTSIPKARQADRESLQ